MAWPPPIPPATRVNSTPQIDAHVLDHNQISGALTELVNRVNTLHRRLAGVALVSSPGQSGFAAAAADITGATVTFTGDPTRKCRVTFAINVQQLSAGATFNVTLANAANTVLCQPGATLVTNAYYAFSYTYEGTFSGATTLKLRLQTAAGTMSINQGAATPTLLVVDEVGP